MYVHVLNNRLCSIAFRYHPHRGVHTEKAHLNTLLLNYEGASRDATIRPCCAWSWSSILDDDEDGWESVVGGGLSEAVGGSQRVGVTLAGDGSRAKKWRYSHLAAHLSMTLDDCLVVVIARSFVAYFFSPRPLHHLLPYSGVGSMRAFHVYCTTDTSTGYWASTLS
jgi:hypothetical protein